MPTRLVTARLLLREWRETDLGPFVVMNADRRVMRLLQGPMTAEQSTASLSRIRKQWEAQGWGLFAVERQDGSALIGFCGLAPVTFEARFSPKVEIGWRLAYDEWGQGFATEAASAVLDWVFGDLRWPEIVSFAREENTASRAVMTRLGMMREPESDFDLPSPPGGEGRPRHLFYRLRVESWPRA